jgi:hypothetical protein
VSSEEESEAYSLAITRCTHITGKATIDFETELMMVEDRNHDDFYQLKCYKCHLMSQSDHPEEKDNPNNVLWMSWSTHQRFDGLHTVDEHRVPQIAISYVDHSTEVQTLGCAERVRVNVAIECPDDGILAVMRNRVKEGCVVDESEKKIFTYLYVQDAEEFRRCLTHKYDETKLIWTKYPGGTEVTEEEAHKLRRSARLVANRKALEQGMAKMSVKK